MSKRPYEEYIKNGCHPVGYNEPCQRLIFSQISIDLLLDQIDQLKQQLAEKDKMHLLDEKEFQNYCAYKWIEPEIKGCLDREREYKQQLAEKQKTIDEINKEFVQAVHDWKALCAEKDKEIASLQVLIIENKNDIKEMREFKFGDNEYDLTDEDARNDIKNQLENQTQLAIAELEKVKNFICDYSEITGQAWNHTLRFLNNKIKELRGEKDVKD